MEILLAELDSEHLFKVWEINAERERERLGERERGERRGSRKEGNKQDKEIQTMYVYH